MSAQTVTFWVPGVPVPQGSKSPGKPRNGKSTMFEAAKGHKRWRSAVAWAAIAVRQNPPWTGPVRAQYCFCMPAPKDIPAERLGWPCVKPDVSKLIRAVEDSCTGIVYDDDGQICESSEVKVYGAQPGVRVTFTRITEAAQEVAA